jgi:hypothetical protein
MTDQTLKKDALISLGVSIGVYSILYLIIVSADNYSPGGPCNPGAGFLIGMVLLPITWTVLTTWSLIIGIGKKRFGYFSILILNGILVGVLAHTIQHS